MRLLRRCGWLAGLGAAALLSALLVVEAPALAAFPGRDGLLAVQPLHGSGIVLVGANGRGKTNVCISGCISDQGLGPLAGRPEWSPDGRTLVISGVSGSFRRSGLIYPDGSCLYCQVPGSGFAGLGQALEASFTNNPTLLTAVDPVGGLATPDGAGLYTFGLDGLPRNLHPLVSGTVADPVWSSRGELALVRGGWVWVGRPRSLHRLVRGSDPSWSPDGSQIVFDRHGWLMIVRLRGRPARRLVRGTAPAWSPDGRWVAFFDKRHRLSIVRTRGGRVRRVGTAIGVTVDWQPLPAKPTAACQTPPGSMVIASSDTGTVSLTSGGEAIEGSQSYWQPTWAAVGCLPAIGREWVLLYENNGEGASSNVSEAAVAGNYAALAVRTAGGKYGYSVTSRVQLFDLRTGCELSAQLISSVVSCDPSVHDRGDEAVFCGSGQLGGCPANADARIDQLVLGSDAVSAAHTTVEGLDTSRNRCSCRVEQIQASDSIGVHTLDIVTEPDGSPAALTNLTLTGNILTWEHNGSPQSAQLQP